MQGIGAAGVTTVVGKTTFAQQEEQTTTQEETAVRFVHAVPGAPGVDVFLEQREQEADVQVDGQEETGNQTATDEETVTGNQTTTNNQTATDEETVTGNQTTTDDQTATDDGTGSDTQTTDTQEPVIEGLQPRSVSSYLPVEPGTYTLRVEQAQTDGVSDDGQGEEQIGTENATDAGNVTDQSSANTTDQSQTDVESGQAQESAVILEEEIELAEQTTYTGVAYGEPAGTAQPESPQDEEPVGEQAGDGNETADTTPPAGAENDTETATEGIGNDTTNTTQGESGGAILQPDEVSEPLVEDLRFGEAKYAMLEPGDYTLEFREAPADPVGEEIGIGGPETGNATDGDTGIGADGNVTDGDVGADENATDGGVGANGNVTEGGVGADENATDGGVGVEQDGNETTSDVGVGQDGNVTDDSDAGAQASALRDGVEVALLRDRLTVEDETAMVSEGTVSGEDSNATSGERNVRNTTTVQEDENATSDQIDGNTTVAQEDENATSDQIDGNTTAAQEDENATSDQIDGNTTAAQEDETTTSAQGMSRIRIFHALQGVNAINVVRADEQSLEETEQTDEVDGNQTTSDTDGNVTSDVGDDLVVSGQDETVQQVEITVEDGVVYSGFAVGNFDATAAAGDDDIGVGTPDADGENATEDIGVDNVTDGTGMDNATEATGTETGDDVDAQNETDTGEMGAETGMQEDATAQADAVAEGFELVFVEDARNGERADGGTDAQEDDVTTTESVTATSD